SERGLFRAHAGCAPRVGLSPTRLATATETAAALGLLRSGGGPRVAGRLAAAEAATTLLAAASAAAEATTAATLTGSAGDLGGRVLQRRTDLFDLELDDGALLTLASLV